MASAILHHKSIQKSHIILFFSISHYRQKLYLFFRLYYHFLADMRYLFLINVTVFQPLNLLFYIKQASGSPETAYWLVVMQMKNIFLKSHPTSCVLSYVLSYVLSSSILSNPFLNILNRRQLFFQIIRQIAGYFVFIHTNRL